MDKNYKDFKIIRFTQTTEYIIYSQRQCENFMSIVDKEGIIIHYYISYSDIKVYHEIRLKNEEIEGIRLEVE